MGSFGGGTPTLTRPQAENETNETTDTKPQTDRSLGEIDHGQNLCVRLNKPRSQNEATEKLGIRTYMH